MSDVDADPDAATTSDVDAVVVAALVLDDDGAAEVDGDDVG